MVAASLGFILLDARITHVDSAFIDQLLAGPRYGQYLADIWQGYLMSPLADDQAVVNAALESGLVHFGVHALVLVSSLIVWMPVLSPLPEIPRLSTPMRGVYLFSQSVVPTVPASFLTFGAAPLYKFYEGLPHLWGLSTLEDQQVAGGVGVGLELAVAAGVERLGHVERGYRRPRTEPGSRAARAGLVPRTGDATRRLARVTPRGRTP